MPEPIATTNFAYVTPVPTIVALGIFGPAFQDRLRGIGAHRASGTDDAVARLATPGSLLIVEAAAAAALGGRLHRDRTRIVVVAANESAADALDALDAGAHEVIGEDASAAELDDAIFARPRLRESSAFHTPRLADLSAKMATIASEIEALLHPSELRHIERAALPPGPAPGSAAHVRTLIRARRARAQYFLTDLFADPAWDILLDLFSARLEHKAVSVSSLCIAAAVPPTTALRWIKTMTDEGLLERKPDPADGRRIFIDLSDRATTAMEAYLARAAAMPGGLAAA